MSRSCGQSLRIHFTVISLVWFFFFLIIIIIIATSFSGTIWKPHHPRTDQAGSITIPVLNVSASLSSYLGLGNSIYWNCDETPPKTGRTMCVETAVGRAQWEYRGRGYDCGPNVKAHIYNPRHRVLTWRWSLTRKHPTPPLLYVSIIIMTAGQSSI